MQNLKITDVRALPGDSAFLIDNGKTSVLYDTGFAFTGYKVAEKIKEELRDRAPDYIFLTHSHYDHALGSVYIKKVYPDVKIVAGEYAAKIFSKPTAREVMRSLDRKFAAKNGIYEYEDFIDELKADITVSDGDIIQAGDMTFTVIALPGHTKCSVGFYLNENKLLLSSETLGVYDGNDTVVPSYLIGYSTAISSIDKAMSLDIESILLPHYGILEKDMALRYLNLGRESAVSTAADISAILKNKGSKQDALEYFKNRFYHGYVKTIYPIDAMELNTSIMIDLIEKELA
ncbi:MAG: MBL fold metallo-hydrolase [Ruminococcaceae bacterium]|nr:MBL fold metallo-hydrolase [Oscillospiraceae bacterium]